MNTDQLAKMTPEEKNLKIMEICGIVHCTAEVWAPTGIGGMWKIGECGHEKCSPYIVTYDTSANAAVQLCDFAASKGWNCEMNQGLNTCWECIFKRRTSERTETTSEDYSGELWEEHYFPADTLSEAISGAFLLTFLP